MENLLGKMQEVMSDKETMQQISELAQMLKTSDNSNNNNNNNNNSPPAQDFNHFDSNMLMKAQELFHQNCEPDKNTALLLALRPHLGEQRQLKIDKAVKLLHLWNIWKNLQETGMLQNLLS
ncbi:MAG: hypothetical protein K2H93_07415 [Oscillospiraceae bacterium]|nr:hypothetical protein [Oscillospiraceae bacterium]